MGHWETPSVHPLAVVGHRVRLVVRGLHVRLPQVHDLRGERAREARRRPAAHLPLGILPPLRRHVRPHRARRLQRPAPLRLYPHLQGEHYNLDSRIYNH